MRAMKNASTAALVGIWMILLTAFVVTLLYLRRTPTAYSARARRDADLPAGTAGRLH